jgi:hypothetical protein
MSAIDAMLDRQRWIDAIERCTDKGVTVRPPIAGISYSAFAVHPPCPPGPIVLAIGHRANGKYVVDLVEQYPSIVDAASALKPYGVSEVTGAESDTIDEDGHAHAVAGVLSLLRQQEVAQ